ncbi:MAG: hypothetical protein ABIS47_06730 [Acidimicrobiales bacterium]
MLAAKAVAVARDRGAVPVGEPQPLLGGAATMVEDGGAWVLVQRDPERALGAALAWSLRHGATTTTCVLDVGPDGRPQHDAAALVAAKAAALAPVPTVLVLTRTAVEAVEPAPRPSAAPASPSALAGLRLADAEAARVDVVVHADGALAFEVLGLEVARVAVDGSLLVGAGKHDRNATNELYGGEPTREALVRAAEVIRQERRAGAQPGPPNLLQRERWLRAALVADPSPLTVVGVAGPLEPVPDPAPPVDLRRPRPAGATADAGRVLIVCSAGIDLDLVPSAAWLAAWAAPSAERIVLVVPLGDDLPILGDMAGLLPVPATLIAVTPPWQDAAR